MFNRIKKGILISFLTFLMASPSFGASHREAPLISLDPAADITDFYAFVSWQNPTKVVFIMNVIPMENPASGPNFFNFADDVSYEIHIDNNKNNIAENIVYQLRFKTEVRNPGDLFPLGFVAVPGTISALDGSGSEGLLLRQSYSVTETRYGQPPRDIGTGTMYAVPSNVGSRTIADYPGLAAKGIYSLSNGGRVFAGQRDDTFYIDLGGAFDTLNLRVSPILSLADDANDAANVAGSVDTLKGLNVNTIAIELPITEIQGTINGAVNKVIGAYASTSRPKVTVIRQKNTRQNSARYVQVSRMGNPLVNELIIATKDKDNWNAVYAEDERQFLDYYCNSSLATALNLVFSTSFPTTHRNDLANTLLRYTPYGTNLCGTITTEDEEPLADLLRLDMGVAPVPAADQHRLGILAHDVSGVSTPDYGAWPNGRRPNDDVTDIALRVVGGALTNPSTPGLGDGVNYNSGANGVVGTDVTANGISLNFPFLSTPFSGRP
ncbi:MAG: DUF4331 domain-containing protein [Nitrospirae bacterium]|nr:DUF4331 domain-containing protein [Nitrospirota bacterium]MBI3351665.1 DUF4331 domain-containing protein [Nitrospirota bacterium]